MLYVLYVLFVNSMCLCVVCAVCEQYVLYVLFVNSLCCMSHGGNVRKGLQCAFKVVALVSHLSVHVTG